MNHGNFQSRIDRINRKAHFAGVGGEDALKFGGSLSTNSHSKARLLTILLGLVIGLISGILVGLLASHSLDWGLFAEFCCALEGPATTAMIMAPVIAVFGWSLQRRYPGLFCATSIYLPSVIAVTLVT